MERWTRACVEQTGSQNVFEVERVKYFWEVSRREHNDGAITGSIFRLDTGGMAHRAGSFRINPDGSVARAPRFLIDAGRDPELEMRDLVACASGR
jgi:hypothetical protein